MFLLALKYSTNFLVQVWIHVNMPSVAHSRQALEASGTNDHPRWSREYHHNKIYLPHVYIRVAVSLLLPSAAFVMTSRCEA